MRIVELPFEFCTSRHLPLAVLVHRTDPTTVLHDIYIGENYTFDGSVEPASFMPLAGHNRFAQHGIVVASYPEDTLTIDREIGVVVRLDGTDRTLDEQSAFNALADDFLLFVGDEIMSVVSAELVALNTYRLHVIRERMATPRQSHAADAEIYLIHRDDLLPLTHRSFDVENEISLKVVNATGSVAQDLSEVDAITHTIEGNIYTQTAPRNLRVQKTLRHANYTAGNDLRLDWSLHELRGQIAAQFGVKIRTLVEIVSLVDDSVLYSKLVYGETFKIATAKVATILGAETSFIVRISGHILGSNLTLQTSTTQLTVTPP